MKKFLILFFILVPAGAALGGLAAYRWKISTFPNQVRPVAAFAVQASMLSAARLGWIRLDNPGGGRALAADAAAFYSRVPAIATAARHIRLGATGGGFLGFLLLLLYVWFSSERRDWHERGARMAPARDVAAQSRRHKCRTKLGSVPIPVRIEPYHFLLSGGTGAGKSQAFFQLMTGTRERGQRAVVVDVGGEFLKRFWRPGDTILNPADARSAPWSPLGEMREPWDSDKLSKSMIPDAHDGAAEWTHYAQVLTSAVLRRMHEAGRGSNGELLRLLNAGSEELAALVAGLPAASLFDPGASRMLASVRGIVGTYLAPYSYLLAEAGEDAFSVRKWVEEDGDSWLFITVRDDQLATLKPLIAGWVDIAISALLSLEPSSTRRLWFLLDEFATLGRIQSIEALLTKARKQGGVGVLGLQSISQLRETYGQHTAQTLLSCLGTWLVLRAPDAETAEYMSRYLGDEEVRRLTVSSTSHRDGFLLHAEAARNKSEHVTSRRIVMASELQALPDRHGVLNLVGGFPACCVEIPVSGLRPDKAKAFVPKPRGSARENTPAPAPAPVPLAVPEAPVTPPHEAEPDPNDPFHWLI